MLFNSFEFVVFFFVVFVSVLVLSRKVWLRNVFLLIASYIFYASWDWRFLGLIILSEGFDAAVVLTLSDKNSPREAFEAFFAQQGVQRGSNQGRYLYSFRAYDPQTGTAVWEGQVIDPAERLR